ncbi:MAG TPA: hypothetical protein VM370_02770 [Candidatus Thermoplasmatota archaeon]|nr:hypothetical protein [Candidatus Thermoplasmatota archaeon]
MRIPALAFAALFALAGCFAPASSPADDGAAAGALDLSQPYRFSLNATCIESDIILLVDMAKLQGQLPDGFHAADASSLGGLPVSPPTGRGAVLATAFVCDTTDRNASYAEGQVAILVDAPDVAGDRPAAFLDFYELYRYVPMGQPGPKLDALGWAHEHGNVSATMTRTSGTGEVVGHEGPAFSMTVTTPGSAQAQGTARFWHDLPTGLAWVDYTFETPVDQLLGRVECDIASGSVLAEASGITTCGPDNSLGMGFAAISPAVAFEYAPGVHASS